jgi:hypothetical protein
MVLPLQLLHPPRDRRLGDRGHRPEHRVDIAGNVRAVAGDGGRLNTRQVVDMVLEQRFETLCGRQLLEGQRALAAIQRPQHAPGVSGAIFWAWMLAATLDLRRLLRRSRRNFGKWP